MKVISSKHAVVHDSSFGPTFGGGFDLYVSTMSNENKGSYMKFSSYESPEGFRDDKGGKFIVGNTDHSFQTIEIEVFEVAELKLEANFKMDSSIISAAQKDCFLELTGLGGKLFPLLWRGSRDGFSITEFHRLCDGKANTVTIINIKNTKGEFIFGGFTSIPWSSDGGYKEDSTAFLFSLTNPSNTPLKFEVKSKELAVYHSSRYGPVFGDSDLVVSNFSNKNRDSYMRFSSYEIPEWFSGDECWKIIVGDTDHNFEIAEIEVLQSFFKMDSAIMSDAQQISFQTLTGLENKLFSLLWRGSRDGFGARTFHSRCNTKANTVTVIKNKNGFIFGGFTSIPWSSKGGYKEDSKAFLFSLTNPSNTPLKLKVQSPEDAVVHDSSFGPTFGGGFDLYVSSLSNKKRYSYMRFNSYEFPEGLSLDEGGKFIVGGSDHNFEIAEIEVFQVL